MAADNNKTVVDLLLDQHDQIRDLLRRVRQSQGEAKQNAFHELVRLLAVHETAEEEVVHPTARSEIESMEQVIQDLLQEENDAKQVLARLYDMGVDHPDFDVTFASLAEDVAAHAEEEEQREFPPLRQQVSTERLKSLARAVEVAEATAPTRPHPAAGESAAANIMAGPPLALFDRVRDAVRDWSKSRSR